MQLIEFQCVYNCKNYSLLRIFTTKFALNAHGIIGTLNQWRTMTIDWHRDSKTKFLISTKISGPHFLNVKMSFFPLTLKIKRINRIRPRCRKWKIYAHKERNRKKSSCVQSNFKDKQRNFYTNLKYTNSKHYL